MAESKPRKSLRKTKIEENSIEDQPIRVGRVSSARKFVRRLSPAPGMDDIAVPKEVEEATIPVDLIEQAIVEDDVYSDTASMAVVEEYNNETSHAHSAVDAQHVHGSVLSFHSSVSEVKSQEVSDVNPQQFNGDLSENFAPKPVQDTNFLASEYTSFDLTPKKKRHWFSIFIIWLLTILIIIGVAVAVVLYIYPEQATSWYKDVQQKILHEGSNEPTQNNNQQSIVSPAPTAPAQIKFGTDTTVAPVAQLINSSIQTQYKSFIVDSNVDTSVISSLNLSSDTLVYKSSIIDQVQQLSTYLLNQFGLQLQLQENDSITDDFVVYLTPTIAAPNLNNETILVNNANGTPGAAKVLCKTLQSYKSGACTSANAAAIVKGTTVSYKDPKIYMVLARMQQFTGATFQAAPASQTTDIVVTLGK